MGRRVRSSEVWTISSVDNTVQTLKSVVRKFGQLNILFKNILTYKQVQSTNSWCTNSYYLFFCSFCIFCPFCVFALFRRPLHSKVHLYISRCLSVCLLQNRQQKVDSG